MPTVLEELLTLSEAQTSLPRDFTIEVHDRTLLRTGVPIAELQRQWQRTRNELVKRGYQVTEWFCCETLLHKARCRMPLTSPPVCVDSAHTGEPLLGSPNPPTLK